MWKGSWRGEVKDRRGQAGWWLEGGDQRLTLQQHNASADVLIVFASNQTPGIFKLRALGHGTGCLLRLKFPFKILSLERRVTI